VIINPTPPPASSLIIFISLGVTAPSSPAKPSQVADLMNRFDNCIPLIVLLSNNLLIRFPLFCPIGNAPGVSSEDTRIRMHNALQLRLDLPD
jgi:hypothetical protein